MRVQLFAGRQGMEGADFIALSDAKRAPLPRVRERHHDRMRIMVVFFVRTLLLVPGATAGVGGGNGRGRRAPLRGVALLARGGHGVPGGGWLSLTPRALSLVRVLPDQCTSNSFEGRKARPTLSSSKLCRSKIQKAVSSVNLNKFLSIHSDEKTGFLWQHQLPDGQMGSGGCARCAQVSGNRKGGTSRGRGVGARSPSGNGGRDEMGTQKRGEGEGDAKHGQRKGQEKKTEGGQIGLLLLKWPMPEINGPRGDFRRRRSRIAQGQ